PFEGEYMCKGNRRLLSLNYVCRPILAIALCFSYLPVAAFGQNGIVAKTPQQTTGSQSTQSQNPITQPLALSPDVPPDRVGINPGQVQTLSLQDAIAMALKNNLDIASFREGVQIAQQNLRSLRGIYDIVSGAEVNYRNQSVPVANLFAGGGTTGSFNSKTINYNFTTNQAIERGGGFWEADFTNNRVNTSNTASTLPTQYNTNFNFQFTQPLLRNFSIDSNRRQIQLAKKSLDLSDSQFRQRVIETINSVQRAYWHLVFAIRNERIARESVELAKTQLDNNRKMVEAGTLAPIELRSNEATLEQNKGNVILALQQITTAENVLKGLLLKEQNDTLWHTAVSRAGEPQSAEAKPDVGEATRLGLRHRPRHEQLRLR